MNILLVTSETLPYCKSGGLGDFIWSYSKALVQKGHDVSVIVPLYGSMKTKFPETTAELYDNYDFQMNWKNQGCGVFHLVNQGVNFYFTAMDEPFGREGALYGYGDDNERFATFMMAVNTFISRHNRFDVVHCNDWQTAVLPLLLTYNPKKIKTVLTIHNPAYQGWSLRGDLPYFFNLSTDYYDSGYARLGDSFNFLKTGIMSADKVNTVSHTHANELMHDHVGFGGMGSIIDWCRHNDFSGIVNGLDTQVWDPLTDKHIGENYDINTYKAGKKVNRDAILHLLDMNTFFSGPLFSVVTRLSSQKGVERIMSIMPLLRQYDARMIVIGTGEMEDQFLYESLKYPEVYFVKKYDENLAHLLYAASDYFLMPSYFEPCGTSQMIAMRYGTLPIVSNVGGLNDTVKDLSVGDEATGFVFDNNCYDGFYNCFKAANEFYFHEPEKYTRCQVNGMKGDYSWAKSADDYLELYKSISWK
ncbi:MAG: glycogen/starch synthase [Bacilli bacterium]